MTLKIAFINIHSFYNAGDEALGMVALEKARKYFPDCKFTLVMNNPSSYSGAEDRVLSFLGWIQKARTFPILRFLWLIILCLLPVFTLRIFKHPIYLPFSKETHPAQRSLLEADLVIGIPGGNLYSYGRGRALLYQIFTMTLVVVSGKPLYLLPQSYGPFQFGYERFIMHWLVMKARTVMVRETFSVNYLKELGIPESKCLIFPDMAFAFEQEPDNDMDSWFKSQGIELSNDHPLLGLSIIDWGALDINYQDQERYERVIANTIQYFVTKYKGKAILFPQTWGPSEAEDDRIPSKRVANLITDLDDNVIVIDTPLNAAELRAAYGRMDLFIGTRMHSNIFAMTNYVPVIPIGYFHKTLGTARLVDIVPWVVDINHLNNEEMFSKLDGLWDARDHIRSHFVSKIPELAMQIDEALSRIHNDYTQHMEGRKH